MNSLLHPHAHSSILLKQHAFIPQNSQGKHIGFTNIEKGNITKSSGIRGINTDAFRPQKETPEISKYLEKIKPVIRSFVPINRGGKIKPRENIKIIFYLLFSKIFYMIYILKEYILYYFLFL